jgi:hypothetical protein
MTQTTGNVENPALLIQSAFFLAKAKKTLKRYSELDQIVEGPPQGILKAEADFIEGQRGLRHLCGKNLHSKLKDLPDELLETWLLAGEELSNACAKIRNDRKGST